MVFPVILMFNAFLVLIAFIVFVALKFPLSIGTYLPILSFNGCRLPTVSWRINPRLSPHRQILVHPGTHSNSWDPEHLLVDGT